MAVFLLLAFSMALNYYLYDYLAVRREILAQTGMRYLWLPVVIFAWMMGSGVLYLKHAFGIKDTGQALEYLVALVFGHPITWVFGLLVILFFGILVIFVPTIRFLLFEYSLTFFVVLVVAVLLVLGIGYFLVSMLMGDGYPYLIIRDGKKLIREAVEEDENDGDKKGERADRPNLLDQLGGPGFLIVQPGSVAVLEGIDQQVRVVGNGRHFVKCGEMIKEVASLGEHHVQLEKPMNATTKDGLAVEVKDVRYRYRLLRADGPEAGPATSEAISFSTEAVKNMVYNRTLNAQGVISWQTAVNFPIDTGITNYINQGYLDQLTAPSVEGGDPRGDIYARLDRVVDELRKRGTELLWIGIGHFSIPEEEVAKQRISTWQTKWAGDAEVIRSMGEAQFLAYQELGRAQAQAELLMSIIMALDEVSSNEVSRQNIRGIYLARIAQLLDAMREQSRALGEGKADSSQPGGGSQGG